MSNPTSHLHHVSWPVVFVMEMDKRVGCVCANILWRALYGELLLNQPLVQLIVLLLRTAAGREGKGREEERREGEGQSLGRRALSGKGKGQEGAVANRGKGWVRASWVCEQAEAAEWGRGGGGDGRWRSNPSPSPEAGGETIHKFVLRCI